MNAQKQWKKDVSDLRRIINYPAQARVGKFAGVYLRDTHYILNLSYGNIIAAIRTVRRGAPSEWQTVVRYRQASRFASTIQKLTNKSFMGDGELVFVKSQGLGRNHDTVFREVSSEEPRENLNRLIAVRLGADRILRDPFMEETPAPEEGAAITAEQAIDQMAAYTWTTSVRVPLPTLSDDQVNEAYVELMNRLNGDDQ